MSQFVSEEVSPPLAESIGLAVFGAGGFTLQLLPLLEELAARGTQIVVADDVASGRIGNFPIVDSKDIPTTFGMIIAVSDGQARARIDARLGERSMSSLIAATARVSPHACMEVGTIVTDFCVIEPKVVIGRHFQMNLFSYVAHECVIGDWVTFAPRVSCNGNVQIEDYAYIGTAASIRQGTPGRPLIIGKGAHIGMGSIITRDVPAGMRVRAHTKY